MKDKKLEKQIAKGFIEVVKSEENETEGKLGLAIISTDTVDRHGDVIKADGWDFKAFKKNPVMLWSHNSGWDENRPSIGKVENIEVKDGKVFFTPVFDMEDGFAKNIFNKFKKGMLNAFSIGFRPLSWKETDTGYEFIEQEALEFSAVNVPANAEALVQLRSAGIGVCKDFNDWKDGKELEPTKELAPNDDEEEDEDEKDEAEGWKTFGEVKLAMLNLILKDVDINEFKKIAAAYKDYGFKAPKFKHFQIAIIKTALGRKIKKKKENEVISLLKQMDNRLQVKPQNP